MLLKSEHDCGVNFGIDLLLCNLAFAVSMECKSLLLCIPDNVCDNRCIGIAAFFDYKRNSGLLGVLDSELRRRLQWRRRTLLTHTVAIIFVRKLTEQLKCSVFF